VVDAEYGCGAHSDTPAPAGTGSPLFDPFDDGVLEVVEPQAPPADEPEASAAAEPEVSDPAAEPEASDSDEQPADEQPADGQPANEVEPPSDDESDQPQA
jgi:hypothetical protein